MGGRIHHLLLLASFVIPTYVKGVTNTVEIDDNFLSRTWPDPMCLGPIF